MSNIDKQSLREQFEAWWEVNYHNGNPPRFDWEYWRDGDGYKIDDDESELDGMWESWQAAHSSKLGAAEKRIAELEAREVVLPQRYSMLHRVDFDEPYHTEMVYKQHQVLKALHDAGVNVAAAAGKGE
ncbi:hypothetical protein [Enterobacter ludwigii]|uniref:hypothetical protein n=1 Tax=Enterobacter ludwigii TaxID=299767 RepID=UPI0040677272